jgi:hypothetical protein
MPCSNCDGKIRGVFPSPSAASQADMSPHAVTRKAPIGQPIVHRCVRQVHPRSLLTTAA